MSCESRHGEALDVINEALRHADDNGERWYYAELCRIKGDVLRKLGRHDEGQRWLATALDWERRHALAFAGARAAGNSARTPLHAVPVQSRA